MDDIAYPSYIQESCIMARLNLDASQDDARIPDTV